MTFKETNQVKWVGFRPGHNGSQIMIQAFTANSTNTVYTVPDNKKFFLTHIDITYTSTASGAMYIYILDDNNNPIYVPFFMYTIDGNSWGTEGKSYWPPIELPEDYYIKQFSNNAGVKFYASYHGWLEDA